MHTLPDFRDSMQCWAHFEYPNLAPGPWFFSTKIIKSFLVFGHPAVGDLVYNADSKEVEIYLGAQEEQNP